MFSTSNHLDIFNYKIIYSIEGVKNISKKLKRIGNKKIIF